MTELRRLEGEIHGSRAFVDVLQLCDHHACDDVTAAIEKALRHERVSVATIRYHLASNQEATKDRPLPFEYRGPSVITTSSAAYAALCAELQPAEVRHG